MDVLEQGDDRSPRRPRRPAGRLTTAVVVLAALTVSGLGLHDLLPELLPADASPTGSQGPSGAPAPPDAPGAGAQQPAVGPEDLPAPPPGAFGPRDYVLLGAPDRVWRLQPGSGWVTRLDLPAGAGSALPGGLAPLGGGAAVTVPPAYGERSVYASHVYLLDGTGGLRRLTGAGPAVPAYGGQGLWVESYRPGTGRSVRRVTPDGTSTGPAVPLVARYRLRADTAEGLVLGPTDDEDPAAVEVVDHVAGRVLQRVTARGVVLDAVGDAVAWAACPVACPVRLTRLSAAQPRRSGQQPHAATLELGSRRLVGDLRLSPDGRHVAAVVGSPGGDAPRYDVVVGHRPGGARAGLTSTPLAGLTTSLGRPPSLSYTSSGWLVVSTGTRLYAVAPGPHPAYRIPVPVPEHEQIVAG